MVHSKIEFHLSKNSEQTILSYDIDPQNPEGSLFGIFYKLRTGYFIEGVVLKLVVQDNTARLALLRNTDPQMHSFLEFLNGLSEKQKFSCKIRKPKAKKSIHSAPSLSEE